MYRIKMKKTFFILFGFISFYVSGQCLPDRHSTNWFDGWVSCESSVNPNPIRGTSHWILYDLGYVYTLGESTFWNTNDPAHLNNGMKDFLIDYSLDGVNWQFMGSYQLPISTGRSDYSGVNGPDFNEILARFVLITPTTNYGGTCFGFSELRINIENSTIGIDETLGFVAFVYPNPFDTHTVLKIIDSNSGESYRYSLTDMLGRSIQEQTTLVLNQQNEWLINYESLPLDSGVYFLTVYQGEHKMTFKLIKM